MSKTQARWQANLDGRTLCNLFNSGAYDWRDHDPEQIYNENNQFHRIKVENFKQNVKRLVTSITEAGNLEIYMQKKGKSSYFCT